MGLFDGLRKHSDWALQRVLLDSTPGGFSASGDVFTSKKQDDGGSGKALPLWNKVDISSHFNTIGTVPDGTSGFSAIGAQAFPPLPETCKLGSIGFRMGDTLEYNCIYITSQTIEMPANKCDAIYIAATTAYGSQILNVRVNYDDGHEDFEINSSDWLHPQNFTGEKKLISFAYRNVNDGTKEFITERVNMYCYTVSIDRNRILNDIVFSSSGDAATYVFAVTQVSNVTDLTSWFKADAITGKENADHVTSWKDSSGKNRHMTISSGSGPTYLTNIVKDYYPVLQFNGTTGLVGSVKINTSHYSVFTVMKSSTTSTFMICTSWGAGGAGTLWQGYNGFGYLVPASDSSNDIISSIQNDNDIHIIEGAKDNTSFFAYNYGELIGSNSSDFSRSNNLYIGSYVNNLFWNGWVAEVVVFKNALGTNARKVVEQYLIAKYLSNSVAAEGLGTEDLNYYLGYELGGLVTEDLENIFETEDEEFLLGQESIVIGLEV